ncbi:MAG: DNA cytosine methyltransferase [Clostridia bacterium]
MPLKYYLSKTSCLGILRRAKARNKELPKQLKDALMIQAGLISDEKLCESLENISFPCLNDQGGERMDVTDDYTGTLRASMAGNLPIVMGSTKPNASITKGICSTLTSSAGSGGGHIPLLFENNACDARYNGPLEVAPTVTRNFGSGGGNIPLVKQESYCIASNIINRSDKNGGNGIGVQKDISYTLTTCDIPAVFSAKPYQDTVGALMHRDHKGVNTCYVNQDKCIVSPQTETYQNNIGALCSGDWKGPSNQYVSQDKCIVNRNLVRRLTPTECERLMGFPDGWTEIEKCSDSARYKALGNSIVVPCVEYIMRGIDYYIRK